MDTICINQSDITEKGVQVPLMGDIYGTAERVIACLPGIPHSRFIASYVHQLCEIYGPGSAKADGSVNWIQQVVGRKKRWGAIRALMQHPYWKRTWIIQELVLAQRVCVLAGDCSVDWDEISEFARQHVGETVQPVRPWLNREGEHIELKVEFETSHATFSIQMVNRLRDELARRGGTKIHIWDVLPHTLLSDASDDRDKVYGILGLCLEADDPRLQPNYMLSRTQVYTDASTVCLGQGCLKLLQFSGLAFRDHREGCPDMASCVCNLGSQSNWKQALPIHHDPERYSAGTGTRAELQLELSSPSPGVLNIRGFSVDTIIACDSPHIILGLDSESATYAIAANLSAAIGLDDANPHAKNFNYPALGEMDRRVLVALFRHLGPCVLSAQRLAFIFMAMIYDTDSESVAQVPDIVVRHVPDPYVSRTRMPRDEAFWRTTMLVSPADSKDAKILAHFHDMCQLSVREAEANQLVHETYYTTLLDPSRQEDHLVAQAALFLKACWFPLTLSDEEKTAVTVSDVLARVVPTVVDLRYGANTPGLNLFWKALVGFRRARQLAVTEKGYLALVPRGTRAGDVICVFNGANVPSVLRPTEKNDDEYELWSGAAYVCGFMEGEAMEEGGERWFRLK